ncbi:uncharacterized protein LOC133318989 [Danaus plexippus]|uniref:uncharacterized protein LOC133318989 n=1 Tax=Danaus plexippus TaxID=13037 RepID=UPI002AB2AF3D|nr:uncharacterized protein LOC133318989 [Danaus plexippus]
MLRIDIHNVTEPGLQNRRTSEEASWTDNLSHARALRLRVHTSYETAVGLHVLSARSLPPPARPALALPAPARTNLQQSRAEYRRTQTRGVCTRVRVCVCVR